MQIRTFVVLLTLSGTLALAQTTSPAPQPSQTPTSSAPGSDTPSTDQKPTDTKPDTKPDTKTETKKDQKQDAAAAAPMPAAEPGESLDPSIKKGTEEDVSAVGQRSIGSRGMGNWYSTNWEIGTGKQYSVEIERSSHLVTDPVVVEYVNRVGQNLVKNSDAKVPFTIKVLDTDEINAMALPGGYFYVNSGLILACDSEDELAGVMAHEIAHVAAHHAAREMTKLNYADRLDSADDLYAGNVGGLRHLRSRAAGGAADVPAVQPRV
jgi:hypothetical protein